MTIALLAIVLVGAAGLGGWALSAVLRPVEDPLEASPFTTVTVEQGKVGDQLTLNTVAEWASAPDGVNQASGVVTDVRVEPGREVGQGAVLYTVDLRPVVAAQGETPAFRKMKEGDEGADVEQLQRMLGALGFYGGIADGIFGDGTEHAVKAWQESLGLDDTGVVELGDVLFVSVLPAKITVDDEVVSRGATLAGGETALRVLPPAPSFRLPLTDDQAGMVPVGTIVKVTSPDGDVWEGIAGERSTDDETETTTIAVDGDDGQSVCADQCQQVPVGAETLLTTKVVTVPTVSGLVVPSAAIVTSADGQTALVDESGERIAITVVASARGMAVVEGEAVSEGIDVRIPGEM